MYYRWNALPPSRQPPRHHLPPPAVVAAAPPLALAAAAAVHEWMSVSQGATTDGVTWGERTGVTSGGRMLLRVLGVRWQKWSGPRQRGRKLLGETRGEMTCERQGEFQPFFKKTNRILLAQLGRNREKLFVVFENKKNLGLKFHGTHRRLLDDFFLFILLLNSGFLALFLCTTLRCENIYCYYYNY